MIFLPNLRCPFCGKGYARKDVFQRHIRDFHKEEFSPPPKINEDIITKKTSNNLKASRKRLNQTEGRYLIHLSFSLWFDVKDIAKISCLA